jgi:hypothetical protein
MRRAAAALAGLVLLAVPGRAAAAERVGLRGVTCDAATTVGSGLPQRTRLDVALIDPASGRSLARGQLTTSASGTLRWRATVSLSGVDRVRAVISRSGQGTPLAFAEQSLARACPLAATGRDRTVPLVGVGLSSFVLGVLLLAAFAYRGRHVAAPGRHLAEPYRSRRPPRAREARG